MTCQDSFHEVAFNISFWTRNISSARILFWRGVSSWYMYKILFLIMSYSFACICKINKADCVIIELKMKLFHKKVFLLLYKIYVIKKIYWKIEMHRYKSNTWHYWAGFKVFFLNFTHEVLFGIYCASSY